MGDKTSWRGKSGHRTLQFQWVGAGVTGLGPPEGWSASLRSHLNTLFGIQAPLAICWGAEKTVVFNDGWREMTGQPLRRPFSARAHDVFHDIWDAVGPALDAVLAGDGPRELPDQPLPTGRALEPEKRWCTYSFTPIPGDDPTGKGRPSGVLIFAVETTARRRAETALDESEARQDFFARFDEAMRVIRHPVSVMGTAARLLGVQLGASRVQCLEADGDLEEKGASVVVKQSWASDLPAVVGRVAMSDFGERVAQAVRRGPVVVGDVAVDPALTPAERAHYERLGIRAWMSVPLLKEGTFAAALIVHQSSPRQWTDAEQAILRETAVRMWTAVDRVASDMVLRESESRLAFLLTLSDALRFLDDPGMIQQTACRLFGQHLRVNRVHYGAVDGGDFVPGPGYARGVAALPPQRIPIASLGEGVLEAFSRSEVVAIDDVATSAMLRPEERASYASAGVGAFMAVLPSNEGRFVCGLVIHSVVPRPWTPSEQQLAREMVDRLFVVVERARSDAALRASEARQGFLVRLADTLRPLSDAGEMQAAAARLLVEELRTDMVCFAEHDRDGILTAESAYSRRAPVARADLAALEGWSDIVAGLRAGRVVTSAPGSSTALARCEARAVLSVPIMKDGRLAWSCHVFDSLPRIFTPCDVSLVKETSERTSATLERAHMEERARQAELRLLEAASEANRAKDEFMAMLGHELRNPLTPILATLDLMRIQRKRAFLKEREVIERQARHMERLVDDLLDVTRIARGKVRLVPRRVNVAALIHRAVETVGSLLEEKRHRLITDIEPGLVVDGDPDRLVQVFSNLFSNAAKYTNRCGRIGVTARLEKGLVVVRVRDNGCGIESDLLPRVFDLFRQGRQTSERAQGGLGLGLAIVRNLVELHGGTVAAASAGVGQGSEFVVHLPTPAAEPAARPDDAAAPAGVARPVVPRRILIVDDNADIANVMAKLLRNSGHAVAVALNAASGVRLARTFHPDLALLDIGLPEIDGYQLARQLKKDPELRRIRLVAVTGYGQMDDRRRALSAGFSEHLVKPIDIGALEVLVARAPVMKHLAKPMPAQAGAKRPRRVTPKPPAKAAAIASPKTDEDRRRPARTGRQPGRRPARRPARRPGRRPRRRT